MTSYAPSGCRKHEWAPHAFINDRDAADERIECFRCGKVKDVARRRAGRSAERAAPDHRNGGDRDRNVR